MQTVIAGFHRRSCSSLNYLIISIIFICLCCGPGGWRRQPVVAVSSPINRTEWISRLRANANQLANTSTSTAAAIGSSIEISANGHGHGHGHGGDDDDEANNRTVRRAKVHAWPFGEGQYQPATAALQRQLAADSTPNDLKLFTLTNICERDFMLITIRTSRPFYGVIHTKNERHKSICSLEGNGEFEFNLNISHALDPSEPNHCGVYKARNRGLTGPGPGPGAAVDGEPPLLSVILAIRMHRNIELSSDKFYLLNCTNRCRRPDCSSTRTDKGFGRLINSGEYELEMEQQEGRRTASGVCSIESFPWLVVLLSLLSVLLLASVVSHCLLCSSLMRHKGQLADQRRRKARAERHERALEDEEEEEEEAGREDDDGWADLEQSSRRTRTKTRREKSNSSKQKSYINYDNRNLYNSNSNSNSNKNDYVPSNTLQTESKRISRKKNNNSIKHNNNNK